ncbi:pimeloyl-ACP methyl ester carboxylesterase [Streptacidiphilus sp. MAP12-16]|uniref:esterase/lipase family protein n=1 Tax=Streptacidiphilus sp. MAP12-16 TaxID=3156300 RepID=UPI003514B545
MESSDTQVGVVFIHGLFSSPAVWRWFLPLIANDPDLSFVTPLCFEYASPLLPLPLGRIPTVNDIADSLRRYLEVEAGGFERLVLVSHSQGGLIVQRYLARMLHDGRGVELARIKRIVLFACPNAGSGFGLPLRHAWLRGNPQVRGLAPINPDVIEAQRTVINQVSAAQTIASSTCPIPIAAYAGETDNIVTPASARSVFSNANVLPGNHFTIVRPDSAQHRSYTSLKHDLLILRDRNPDTQSAQEEPAAGPTAGHHVDIRQAAFSAPPPAAHKKVGTSDFYARAALVLGRVEGGINWPYGMNVEPKTLEDQADLKARQRVLVNWAERYGLKTSTSGCCPYWLLRDTSRKCTPDIGCQGTGIDSKDAHWSDHSVYWLKDGRPSVISTAPYRVTKAMKDRLAFWEATEPVLQVALGTGWYGHGTTQIIMWRTDRIENIEPAHA